MTMCRPLPSLKLLDPPRKLSAPLFYFTTYTLALHYKDERVHVGLIQANFLSFEPIYCVVVGVLMLP